MATSTSTSDAASAPSVTDVDTVEVYAMDSEDVLCDYFIENSRYHIS